jgi:wyosine [tRNA(Phe)-imidazoG37] synthetase (radical SAM superfamily)
MTDNNASQAGGPVIASLTDPTNSTHRLLVEDAVSDLRLLSTDGSARAPGPLCATNQLPVGRERKTARSSKGIKKPFAAPVAECAGISRRAPGSTAFGCPRNFLANRFVYTVVSSRARGLSIGINMNPDGLCNFNCVYCEVNRNLPAMERRLDVGVMVEELETTLSLVQSGTIREYAPYRELSDDLLKLRHVALSGDGEPTLSPIFAEVVQGVVHVRARHPKSFFKLALITNGTGLDSRPVQKSLRYFTCDDEIWIKLDAGTQSYMKRVNRSKVALENILANALLIGQQRPIVIQSLFALVAGEEPPEEEIDEYISRLNHLKLNGAQIALVQIYSASVPVARPDCRHMPLKTISRIRQRIKAETGLQAEVF